ncbi:single-stranded-DNA-specific exonuclease RecJ [uncultured Peptoniphilus sp.]|uniref:single-stranded-DNA-specific exonuclease RecJ n=1 Tax=uncultured Peptoniphilus sp. TaxID=254354 RepID=UPI0028064B32|nr:single-stranded-DNA-specific exonuclease RecJ [uncultured Peptoniphilus sp.]
MEKWFIKNTRDCGIDYKKFGLNEILYRVILNRGIKSEEELEIFLNGDLSQIHSPILLKDMIKAANIINNSINKKEKIRIVGDYDVDGISSTYILYKGLQKLGSDISFDIPDRVSDGYGINERISNKAMDEGVKLIVTCDNGIAAFTAANFIKENGLKLVITDHHEVAKIEDEGVLVDKLPEADAIIDPKQEKCSYPFSNICGAEVAFKLIEYLYMLKGFEKDEVYRDFISYLALATICDVMPLTDENRIFIKEGIKYLKVTDDVGLSALIDVCDIKRDDIGVYHLGFILGPTLNSCGRLDSAKKALDLLLTDDYNVALGKAKEIRQINYQRQDFTDEALKKAEDIIKEEELLKKEKVLIIYIPDANESVVGIVASRLKEKYYRPTLVLTNAKDVLKGSGRSINEYNMYEEISFFRDMLEAFGGHKMACGLSIKEENLQDFIEGVNKKANLSLDDLTRKIYIDYPLSFGAVNMQLLEDLKKFEPYGTENERPLFGSKNLSIIDLGIFGKNKNVIKMLLSDGKISLIGILFEKDNVFLNKLAKVYGRERVLQLLNKQNKSLKIDIVYSLDLNTFRGNSQIQLKIKSFRVSGEK